MSDTRIERDSMGEMTVPAAAYHGAQTARAVENFPISGLTFPRAFVRALGLVRAACARVIGHDATIAVAMSGSLDRNVMMPVIAHALHESVRVFAAACRVLARRCVAGIQVNVERCREYGEPTGQLVTAIAPAVGYDRAAELFKKGRQANVPIRRILEEEQVLPREQIAEFLDLQRLARGGRASVRR